MFSQTTEYALRAMVCLSDNEEGPLTTRQIAERTQVPFNYLSKVILSLVKAELVHSQRGLHGGSMLAKPPGEISLLDVINAVEPLNHIERCPLGLKQHEGALCPLHRRLEESICRIEREYSSTTLDDLLQDPSQMRPLCEMES